MQSFYSISSKNISKTNIHFRIRLNADHPIYKGHFPEFAVVPGALLVQILGELMEMGLEKKLYLSEASSIKFLKIIVPSKAEDLEVEILIKESDPFKVNAEFRMEGETYCKILATYSF